MIPTDQSNITNNNEFPPSSGSVGEIWIRQKDNMVMVFVPEGKFIMGAIDGDPYAETDELPRHEVAMSSFWIDSTEITNLQYTIFLNSNGNLIDDAGYSWYNDKARGAEIESTSDGYHSVEGFEQRPVTFVSWYGAKVYCQWGGGDLPTEAQWEYACRAGTNTDFNFGNEESTLGDYAWFSKNAEDVSEKYAHKVGQKKPNAWGLHDMHGNVWEWCLDCKGQTLPGGLDPIESQGSHRVVRGGGWSSSPRLLHSALRNGYEPKQVGNFLGFRIALIRLAE
jgi:formylglycine-generating enzyme required for sulfatase activity